MRAAVLVSLRKDLELMQLAIPELKPGQVLVRLVYSGACHSQVMEAGGHRGEDRFLPHLLGHEATGEVMKVGGGVTKVTPGDFVILGWIRGAGQDAPGAQYQVVEGSLPSGTLINSGGVTTFSEYTVVSENRCVRLPKGVPLDVGILFGCALPTGAGIVMNEIKPAKGSALAVIGLGGIGMSALLMAKAMGCKPLVAIDVEPAKLELARSLGADVIVHIPEQLSESDFKHLRECLAAEIGHSRGLDFVVEASGQARCIEFGFSLLKAPGGLCVFASHPKAGDKIKLDPFAMIQGRRLQGSWGGATQPDRDIPLIAARYLAGELPLERLLSSTYELENINMALQDLRQRKIGCALIRCGGGGGISGKHL